MCSWVDVNDLTFSVSAICWMLTVWQEGDTFQLKNTSVWQVYLHEERNLVVCKLVTLDMTEKAGKCFYL